MAGMYKKPSIRVPAPKRASLGAVPPKVRPLKSTYSKAGLKPQPFGGFGDTGLAETPSIIGMGRSSMKLK